MIKFKITDSVETGTGDSYTDMIAVVKKADQSDLEDSLVEHIYIEIFTSETNCDNGKSPVNVPVIHDTKGQNFDIAYIQAEIDGGITPAIRANKVEAHLETAYGWSVTQV